MASKSLKIQTNKQKSSANSIQLQSDKDANIRKSKFWGLCCESGKKYSQILQEKVHITMAALDSTVVSSSVVSLMLDSSVEGDTPYILCNLKNGTVMQVNLNILLDKGEKITFSLKGHGQVHLSGYHIFDKDDSLKSESVEKVSPSKLQALLKNKSQDEALLSKTEKVKKNTMKELKKPTNVKETSKKDNIKMKKREVESDDDDVKEISKKGNIKMEKGGIESDDDSEDDEELDDEDDEELDDEDDEDLDDEDEESEEESTDDDRADLKNDSKKLKSYKRLRLSLNPSDSENDDSGSSESEEDNAKVSSKKLKRDNSISSPNKKNTPLKSAEVINIDMDEPKSNKKTPKTKNALLNSSIGNTPMPKNIPKVDLFNDLSPKKVSFVDDDDEELSGSDNEMDISCEATPNKQGQLTPPASESKKKKKKKKKKKAALNSSIVSDATPNKVANTGLASATYSQKLPGGVEYEDIRPGNGPLAKKGRLVHVYYTGMLENNKVFDSREPGNKPFSFKLGAEQVIKGWDVAIEGMKVGGSRRMKIPPSFGYKNQRLDSIPPNSTLYFNVDLKAVS